MLTIDNKHKISMLERNPNLWHSLDFLLLDFFFLQLAKDIFILFYFIEWKVLFTLW